MHLLYKRLAVRVKVISLQCGTSSKQSHRWLKLTISNPNSIAKNVLQHGARNIALHLKRSLVITVQARVWPRKEFAFKFSFSAEIEKISFRKKVDGVSFRLILSPLDNKNCPHLFLNLLCIINFFGRKKQFFCSLAASTTYSSMFWTSGKTL